MGKLLVMVFAGSCSHDKSCQNFHPDTHICTQYKTCNVTDLWLRSNLYRDTAPVVVNKIPVPYMFSALNQLCTATAPGSEKHCTRMAKTAPYPPCTGILRSAQDFWLKYQDPDRCLRRVTLTKLYRRAISQHKMKKSHS